MTDKHEPLRSLSGLPAFQVGRVAGIPVRLDATFAIMAATVLLSLFLNRALGLWQFFAVYAFVLAGLTLSILCHELAHAVVARKYGLRAEEIRIGAFFGFVELSGSAARRSEAIAILLAGPLANGLIFVGLWLLLGAPALTDRLYFDKPIFWTGVSGVPALRVIVQWLALANFGMLVFNLLPAFPLDGGRIGRLLIEQRVGDARAVRVVAALGIGIGVWSFFGLALNSAFIFCRRPACVRQLRGADRRDRCAVRLGCRDLSSA